MLRQLTSRLQEQTATYIDDIYWFTALLSLLPAIRANLLFSFIWPDSTSRLAASSVTNSFGLWAFALALICLLLALASKKHWRHLAVLCYAASGTCGIVIGEIELGAAYPMLSLLYVALAFGLFVYFVVAGSVRSPAFFLIAVLLIGLQQFDAQLDWPQVIVFIVVSLVASLISETIRQNWPLARQLGRSNLFGLTWRTLRLWWPMLILIYFGIQISDGMTTATEEAIYASGAVQPYCYVDAVGQDAELACPDDTLTLADDALRRYPVDEFNYECVHWPGWRPEVPLTPKPKQFPCPVADPKPDLWSLTQLGFLDSLDRSVERAFDVRQWQLSTKIAAMQRVALNSAEGAAIEARKVYEVVPETTGMKGSSCGLLKLSCHAANIVIGELNDAYELARSDGEEKFVGFVQGKAIEANGDFQKFSTDLRDEIQPELEKYERRTRSAIAKVHTASNAVRQVLLLWLVVIAIKSFLFVFARVIFDQSTDIDVDLLEQDGMPRQGRVRQVQEVDIAPDYPHTLYYKANYQPLGPAPRFSIPQWRASLLSRLRFGAWNMSQVRMPLQADNRVTFNSIEGEHLVDWTLEEGEEVVFSYRNFVAMNENIELRTVVSLRIATLLLGRIVFHTARCKKGTGRLLLRTRGKPATAAQVQQSIPVARLVAWNRYARFSVDSHLTTTDIFLNGFNLRRTAGDNAQSPQGVLIVEADARDGGILVGTLRFAKTFLLPV